MPNIRISQAPRITVLEEDAAVRFSQAPRVTVLQEDAGVDFSQMVRVTVYKGYTPASDRDCRMFVTA